MKYLYINSNAVQIIGIVFYILNLNLDPIKANIVLDVAKMLL